MISFQNILGFKMENSTINEVFNRSLNTYYVFFFMLTRFVRGVVAPIAAEKR